ncbi:MAG: hypothetical protein HW394_16 [Acidobacteria bacterium]|nr:hypothetical protein [Acidobacteriota bacterium]
MTQRSAVGRLIARLTGGWHLERLAAVEEKVGAFGRAQREALAAQGRQLEDLQAAVPTRASAEAIRALERRVDDLGQLIEHQSRTVSEALERARVLDDQAIGDRRFARRIEELLRHRRPVIVGPWTGEVGFEVIYWVPFVRWVVRTYRIPPERLLVVSRGGTRSWYDGLAARYADAFEFFSPDEFRVATEEAKKQRRVGGFDAELVTRVASAHELGRPDLLHPGMMYRLFMPFWKDLALIASVEKYAAYERLPAVDDPVLRDLPADYVAARFYFSECFPDTPANRAFVASTIDSISRQTPVVLLNTPFAVDDHRDWEPAGGRVYTVSAHMAATRNLAVQTAVISRARAFVGTYGGYSYLAPFCGVPSLAFYSERTFKASHLQVARRALERLGHAALVPMHVSDVPLLRLAAGAVGVETTP